jgi:predicted GNAT family N-acyltransferase
LISKQDSITKVYQTVKTIIEDARNVSYQAVNFAMVKAYWDIGRVIFEEEQRGKTRADYGSYLIKELAKKLSQNLGKGFDISNLKNMRQFYLGFPNGDALRRQLSWTHYRLIMRVDKKEAREFYMVEAINNKWGTRELERQIHSLLFERLALSRL